MRTAAPQKGFTLLELLLYVSVASILLVGVVSFLIVLQTARVKQTTISEVEQQGQQVMEYITQTIRNAEGVTSPTAGTDDSALTLDVVAAASDPTVIALSGGRLQVSEGAAPTTSYLTSDHVTISDLTFSNSAISGTRDSITVSFTLSYLNLAGTQEYTYEATFSGAADTQPN